MRNMIVVTPKELQNELDEAQSTYGNNVGAMERIRDLENKLNTIKRIADYEKLV